MELLFPITLIWSFLIIAVLLSWRRMVARRHTFFSQTVPEAFQTGEIARGIMARYRRDLWVYALACCGVTFAAWVALGPAPSLVFIFLTLTVLFMGGVLFSYQRAVQAVRPHHVVPPVKRVVSLEPPPPQSTMALINKMLPFLALCATFGILVLNWDTIPDRYPIHANFKGEIDGWATKSYWSVLRPTVAGLWLMAGLQPAFEQRYRAPDGMRTLPAFIGLGSQWLMAVVFGAITLVPLDAQGILENPAVPIIVVVFTMVSSLAMVIVMALKMETDAPAARGHVFDEDRFWTAGFYRNPDDGALFVEKRLGMGYTVNIGHPEAKWWLWGFVIWMVVFLLIMVI